MRSLWLHGLIFEFGFVYQILPEGHVLNKQRRGVAVLLWCYKGPLDLLRWKGVDGVEELWPRNEVLGLHRVLTVILRLASSQRFL